MRSGHPRPSLSGRSVRPCWDPMECCPIQGAVTTKRQPLCGCLHVLGQVVSCRCGGLVYGHRWINLLSCMKSFQLFARVHLLTHQCASAQDAADGGFGQIQCSAWCASLRNDRNQRVTPEVTREKAETELKKHWAGWEPPLLHNIVINAQPNHPVQAQTSMDDRFRREVFHHTSAVSWRSKSVSLI